MENGFVTIREIAERLNISPSTVSRALSDHPRIGLRTKMRVKELAEELGYEPNRQAIAFKQRKTFTLGLILPGLQEEFFSDVITGIEDVALRNGYSVLIGQSHNDIKQEKRILKTMLDHRVDGLLVSISKDTADIGYFKEYNKHNIPIIFFDRVPQDSSAINAVWCNIYDTTIKAIDYLFEKGYKKIAYLRGPETLRIKDERIRAYKDSLEQHNVVEKTDYVIRSDLSSHSTWKAMNQLLHLMDPPNAVIAFNDTVALDAIRYCREQGLEINKDICFVSYGNWPITEYMESRPLISVEQFPYEQGSKAAELLFAILDTKGNTPPQNIMLESEVVVHG